MKTSGQQFEAWEKAFGKIVTPFEDFIHKETTSGLILMACAVTAMVIANSLLYETYEHVLHAPVGFILGIWQLEFTLHHIINDGMMWLFLFLVGREIKPLVLVGKINKKKKAPQPLIAAIGCMCLTDQ